MIDRSFVENIPLNGRSFQTLILLTPGAVVTVTAFDDQGQFSVNGQRADANYFTVDGVSANFGVTGYSPLVQSAGGALPALSAQGGTNSLVSADAMQEFRIQTSSFAPEFGRTPGGQISIVTRSGTNIFHGELFDYFRNSVLDANDWFANYNHLPKPAERQSDFWRRSRWPNNQRPEDVLLFFLRGFTGEPALHPGNGCPGQRIAPASSSGYAAILECVSD